MLTLNKRKVRLQQDHAIATQRESIMDTSCENYDRFIDTSEASQNGKRSPQKIKINGTSPSGDTAKYENLAVYKDVCTESQDYVGGHHHKTSCLHRRSTKICFGVFFVILVLVGAALCIFVFGFGKNVSSMVFKRSNSNSSNLYSGILDGRNFTNSSYSVNGTARTFPFGVPFAEGRPPWIPCDDGAGSAEVLAVHTKDCITDEDDVDRCRIKKGSSGVMQVLFKAPRDVESLSIKSCGSVITGFFGLPCVPQELNQPDACVGSNLQCPLRSGQTYLYSAEESVRVALSFGGNTALKVNTRISLYEEKSEDLLFCIIIPIKLFL